MKPRSESERATSELLPSKRRFFIFCGRGCRRPRPLKKKTFFSFSDARSLSKRKKGESLHIL